MDTKREHRTHAEGLPRGNPYDLTYSPSGRLIGKSRSNSSVTLSASADMAYGYCDDYQPHAVKRMFDYKSGTLYDLRWDDAGNLGQVSMSKPGEMFEAGRFLFWTEDNRMHTAVDDRYYSYYAYDHSGGSCASREQSQACLSYAEMEQRRRSQRRLKLVGDNCSMDVNAEYMNASSALNEPTLYPSAYMVLTNRGYTNVAKAESRASLLALPRRSSVTVRKHYYAGTDRVAARMGGGGLDALYHVIGNNNTIQTKANLLFDQSLDQVNNRVLLENDLDCIMNSKFAKEEFGHPIDDVPSRMQAGVEPNHDQFKYMMNSMLFDFSQGDEPDVYFYHSDHLGSASWITDSSGVAVQHIQYLPYGEPYINQRLSGYNERFTFTGNDPRKGWRIPLNEIKYNEQRDEETGYGYFGARYMDHELMTMWLSVDPMADKYPGISPYAYCSWNPVKLVDPDGMSYDGYESTTGEYKWFDNHTEQCFADNNGVKWTKITDNKSDWIEATTIRDANIEGLVSLGYDRDQVGKDVRLYNADNSLFTKESILLNPDNYIKDWTASNNSGGPMAAESPEIKKSGYSLKYYPSKNGIKEALGIVKNNGFSHKVEAALELVERMVFKNNADKDPLYDMHYRNACGLIKGLHIKKADVSSYSNYHKSGGMKLP